MSGSPKYSTISVGSAYARREADRRAQQAAARRARERKRAKERAALAARRAEETALRRARARAETERRKAELAARRAAEQAAHADRTRQEHGRADARRLDEVRELIDLARSGGGTPAGEIDAIERQLTTLRDRTGRGDQLGDAIEEVRGRVVALHPSGGGPARRTEPGEALAVLERRLAETGADGAARDAAGHRRCVELLDQLRAATGPGQEVRFEALLGTAEHALVRHAADVRQAVDDERRRADAEAEAQRQRQEAERERTEAQETALAEAADRLDVVRGPASDAAADAVELADPALAGRLRDALRTVDDALAARRADAALTAVAALEELLPSAEAHLDELQLAHTRRSDLARALTDAMTGEGFAFTGGEEQGERFLLHFARPTGATYETTVATDADGAPVLVYHVDGEPDVSLRPSPEGAVCDSTADLLERVHEALGEDGDGFVPGELTWEGKPPQRRAKQLPGGDTWRWTQ